MKLTAPLDDMNANARQRQQSAPDRFRPQLQRPPTAKLLKLDRLPRSRAAILRVLGKPVHVDLQARRPQRAKTADWLFKSAALTIDTCGDGYIHNRWDDGCYDRCSTWPYRSANVLLRRRPQTIKSLFGIVSSTSERSCIVPKVGNVYWLSSATLKSHGFVRHSLNPLAGVTEQKVRPFVIILRSDKYVRLAPLTSKNQGDHRKVPSGQKRGGGPNGKWLSSATFLVNENLFLSGLFSDMLKAASSTDLFNTENRASIDSTWIRANFKHLDPTVGPASEAS